MVSARPTKFILGDNTPGAYEEFGATIGAPNGIRFRCPCGCGTLVTGYFEEPCPADAVITRKIGELPHATLTGMLKVRLGKHPVHWSGWLIRGVFTEDKEIQQTIKGVRDD